MYKGQTCIGIGCLPCLVTCTCFVGIKFFSNGQLLCPPLNRCDMSLHWLGFFEYGIIQYNVWVSPSILLQMFPMRTNFARSLRCRLLCDKVGHSTVLTQFSALHAPYRMPKCFFFLNCFESDLDPTRLQM